MNNEINERLKKYRIFNKLTINELAIKLNLSIDEIVRIETKGNNIDLTLLEKLAKLYNVSIDDLINKDPVENKKVYDSNDKNYHFNFNDINIEVKKSKKVDSDEKINKRNDLIRAIVNCCSYLVVLIVYLTIGFLTKDWSVYWTLFFIPGVIDSIVDSINSKKITKFNITFLVLFIYLFIGMYINLWHPTWAVFFIIPLFYSLVCPIQSKYKEYKNTK